MKINLLAVAAAMAVASAMPVSASLIPISSVAVSSTWFTYDSINLINGNGLLGGGLHSGDFTTKWMADFDDVTPTLTFDLGSVFDITSTNIWNYNGGCCDAERSVSRLSVSTSVDGVTFDPLGALSLSFVDADPFLGETFGLVASARYVRFMVTSNYGADSFSGLSEVQFSGGVVPEPATWAMLITGFGAIGFALRRRRAAAFG